MSEISASETPEKKWSKKKLCTWISCSLWILSAVLSFVIHPTSQFIWLPDAVLLSGFFPLLYICPYSIIWIAFGISTAFIGFFLLTLGYTPDGSLPAETIPMKKHLAEYHPSWSWMIIGCIAAVCGTARLLLNTMLCLLRKKSKIAE